MGPRVTWAGLAANTDRRAPPSPSHGAVPSAQPLHTRARARETTRVQASGTSLRWAPGSSHCDEKVSSTV